MLKGKIILITGASRGIGKAIALVSAQNHAEVILNYKKSEKEAREIINTITKNGQKAHLIKADISNEGEIKKMFDKISKKYKNLDILVNNAGILKKNLLLFTKTEEYEEVMDINCRGTFLCMRYAAKIMMKQKSGKIINVASIMGRYGASGYVSYSASKSAVIGMTKAAAQELGIFGIQVNAVAPGIIETEMIKNVDGETRHNLIKRIALKRLGKPEDIARAALFLSSSMSDYVSGQILGVDGGQIIM